MPEAATDTPQLLTPTWAQLYPKAEGCQKFAYIIFNLSKLFASTVSYEEPVPRPPVA